MKAITFADSKFIKLAQEQSLNFKEFGLEHEIVEIPEQTYGIELWMYLLNQTIEQIKLHGKIFRVDSEIRLHKPIPQSWKEAQNVLFYIQPIITNPYLIPINTGHMILSHSGINFIELLYEMTLAWIPPNYSGEKLSWDDEDLTGPAIRVSKINHLCEMMDYERNDDSHAACTRGSWFTQHTIFTHPFIHNWNTIAHNIEDRRYLRNHFCPGESIQVIDAILLGLEKKNTNKNYWLKLGFDDDLRREDWRVDPSTGAFWHKDHPSPKYIESK